MQPVILRFGLVAGAILLMTETSLGQVTSRDLVDQLLAPAGISGSTPAWADFNEDGVVNVADVIGRVESSQATFIGRVYDVAARAPLAEFTVSVAGSESTRQSFSDGVFEFFGPIGGGGARTLAILRVEAQGYTYCERKVEVIPGDRIHVGDVFLVPLDPATATIGPEGGDYRSSDGNVEVSVPSGAVGDSVTLRSATFPMAESLPAPLPKSSHFTYCIDLLPDETQFTAGVTVRLRNTRGIPAGAAIPVGSYSRHAHEWIPEGMATVSEDGEWVVWPVTHFTPYDINYPPPPPPDPWSPNEEVDGGEDEDDEDEDEDCETDQQGSRVSTRFGNLKQHIPLFSYVRGTEKRTFMLEYDSRCAWPTAILGKNDSIALSDGMRVPSAREVEISINGFRKAVRFDAREGSSHFSWLLTCRDNQEAWWASGVYTGWIGISHLYPVEYYTAEWFGGPPIEPVGVEAGDDNLQRQTARYSLNVPVLNLRDSPLGRGWAVGGLQRIYCDRSHPPLLVEGTKRQIFGPLGNIRTIAGSGRVISRSPIEEGMPALNADLDSVLAASEGLNHELFLLTVNNNRGQIYRVDCDGRLFHYAGGGERPLASESIPATDLQIMYPQDLAVDTKGNVFFSQYGYGCGWIDVNGTAHPVRGLSGSTRGMTLDESGILYVAGNNWLKRLHPPYTSSELLAGGGDTLAYEGIGLDTLEVRFLGLSDVAVDSAGNVYIVENKFRQIYRVGVGSGRLELIAGRYDSPDTPHVFDEFEGPAMTSQLADPLYLAVDTSDLLYFSDQGYHTIARISPDGMVERVAGRGEGGWRGDGRTARNSYLFEPSGISFTWNGSLLISLSGDYRVRQVDLGWTGAPNGESPSPPGDKSRLVLLPDNAWQRLWPDGRLCHFNEEGLLLLETDSQGNSASYTYDAMGRPTGISDDDGDLVTYEYGSSPGRIAAIVGPAGGRWELSHDSDGNLTAIQAPDGEAWAFEYDNRSLMTAKTPPGLGETRYEYEKTRVARVIRPQSGTMQLAHSALTGLVDDLEEALFPDEAETHSSVATANSVVTDGTGNVQTISTNGRGLPLSVVDALGNTTRYRWNASCHGPIETELAEGNRMERDFSQLGNPLSYTLPGGKTFTFLYDSEGELVRREGFGREYFIRDSQGRITERYLGAPDRHHYKYAYDADGRLVSVTDPFDNTAEFAYDSRGNLSWLKTFGGHEYSYQRDGAGFLSQIEGDCGIIGTIESDAMGRPITLVDAADRVTTIQYHPNGRMEWLQLPDGRTVETALDQEGRLSATSFGTSEPGVEPAVVTAERDTNGRIIRQIDPNGNATSYEYDAAGRMTSITDALGNTHRFGYDGNGDVTSYASPGGRSVSFSYSPDRFISEIAEGENATSFTYLGLNLAMQKTRADGGQVNYEYSPYTGLPSRRTDNRGQVSDTIHHDQALNISGIESSSASYDYGYDPDGRLIRVQRLVNPFYRHTENYTRDSCGRLLAINSRCFFTYDPAGRLSTYEDNAENTVTFHYSPVRDIPSRIDYPGGIRAEYTYTPLLRPKGITVRDGSAKVLFEADYEYDERGNCVREVVNGQKREYIYDALYRLVEVRYDDLTTHLYTYDVDGNRLSGPQGEEYSYDSAGRLISAGDLSYEYDQCGNVTRRVSPAATVDFKYNVLDQVVEYEIVDVADYICYYDVVERRATRRKTVPGKVTFDYFVSTPYSELECQGGWTTWLIRHPLTGQPLSFSTRQPDRRCFVHHDAHQRPVMITSEDGSVVWEADYDPFGRADVATTSTLTYPYRLPGQYFDEETGLHYNHHRYYDPMIGRYLQPDPALERTRVTPRLLMMAEPYAYAHSNPLNEFDPTGLCRECDDCPGGVWTAHQSGAELGLILGGNTYRYEAWCTSNPAKFFTVDVDCFKVGLWGGLSVTGGPAQLTGCSNAEAVESLGGWGGFLGGSIGPFTVGGSISFSDWEDYSVGAGGSVGLPLGVGVQYCGVAQ